jgi:hypothetical protein
MSAALILVLFCTVAVLVTHGYFLLGSLPAVVLRRRVSAIACHGDRPEPGSAQALAIREREGAHASPPA